MKKEKLSGATVLSGLEITGTKAQNEREKAKQKVLDWLKDLQ